MKRIVHRVRHLSLKVLAGAVILLCLAVGLAGLILPIVPGLLLLALAVFIAARHFPAAERWVRSHPAVGSHMSGAHRFSRITLSRLTLGERLRLGVLLCAKALVDGAVLVGGLLAKLMRRAQAAGTVPRSDSYRG